MYRIALCDDEKDFLNLIETKIRHYCDEHNITADIKSYYDSDLLSGHIEEEKTFDLFILDIKMPVFTGMELADQIAESYPAAQVLLLTAYDDFAVRAFQTDVCGYILKNRLNQDLGPALDKVFRKLDRDKKETYLIVNQQRYVKIYQSDILYIYKEGKNARIQLKNGQTEWERITIQDMLSKLNNRDMFLLDRGTILNVSNVIKITGNQIVMEGGMTLKSSRFHIQALKEHFLQDWENEPC